MLRDKQNMHKSVLFGRNMSYEVLVDTYFCILSYYEVLVDTNFCILLQDIDVKRQGAVSAYAFVQFTDIRSVVKVLKEMEGEVWGSMKLKVKMYFNRCSSLTSL